MESLGNRHIFGMVKVGERGQIVIPKQARDLFGIQAGDNLMLIGDESSGLAIITSEKLNQMFTQILEGSAQNKPEESEEKRGGEA